MSRYEFGLGNEDRDILKKDPCLLLGESPSTVNADLDSRHLPKIVVEVLEPKVILVFNLFLIEPAKGIQVFIMKGLKGHGS